RGLFTLQDAPGIDASLAVKIGEAAAIAHQATGQGEFPVWEDRGQRMAGRQRRELSGAQVVEGTGADKDRTNALLRQRGEGRFEVAVRSGTSKNELHAQRARARLKVCDDRWGLRKGRVRENAKQRDIGYQVTNQLQSFRCKLDR